ncbi:sugar-binding protein [uncultured Selenomonas sp.]|jgi:putative multiple sugar transport system substrate-binding protein|uniref:substrate-binding domain-containing protein n=1 Tax=uncultured Selenomonas sp. TaxID=159275 RepID=UPI0025E4C7AB|nr:sugar-binding protein [uncultured Selenomonas sp.]
MKRKNIVTALFLVLGALAMMLMAGCGAELNKHVAIAFPSSATGSIWEANGNIVKDALEKEGYKVDIAFADTADQQVGQMEELIKGDPGCLVVAAVDAASLNDVLAEAKKKNIPVIAYDRLLMNTDAISYYATFDNEAVGRGMGEYVEAVLNLPQGGGPYTMELVSGDPADNNAHLFYKGTMDVLKPYIDKGQIVVPSGEMSFEQTACEGWKPERAEERMKKLLAGPDAGQAPDIIIAANDSLSAGARKVMKAAGITKHPIMTGQDAEPQALEAIQNGEQAMTTFKDPNVLCAKIIRMIKAVVDGTEPEINDVTTYSNGVITVPSYLCTPLVIDKDNLSVVKK